MNPLIDGVAYRLRERILQHPAAPAWNYRVGDRVERVDVDAFEGLRERLQRSRRSRAKPRVHTGPPEALLERVDTLRGRVAIFAEHLHGVTDLAASWAAIPTMSRSDLVERLVDVVPVDADLARLIVYDTSGTTGHALHVPHHPGAMAQNHALLEHLLALHGARPKLGPGRVACFNVGAHLSTVMFATVFAVWGGAGFAKVNLHRRVWDPARARRFFEDLEPELVTGDPLGLAELLAWDVDARPAAIVSSATTLTPALAAALRARFGCPVIDSYATTETGVVAATAPDGFGLEILPPDLHVELVDADGAPVPEGARGEICVSGGRNPYLPLLRYRTGDFARFVRHDARGRAAEPRLVDLEARAPVVFLAGDGAAVSPVDVGRIIRTYPVAQHAFTQRRDRSCALAVRPIAGSCVDVRALGAELEALFGPSVPVAIEIDATLGAAGKVVPFTAESGPGDYSSP